MLLIIVFKARITTSKIAVSKVQHTSLKPPALKLDYYSKDCMRRWIFFNVRLPYSVKLAALLR
jgi:ABC-type uncharacterized transport system YnjBCD ATPase subunit